LVKPDPETTFINVRACLDELRKQFPDAGADPAVVDGKVLAERRKDL
jgi:hypothetical protein